MCMCVRVCVCVCVCVFMGVTASQVEIITELNDCSLLQYVCTDMSSDIGELRFLHHDKF